MRYVIGITGSIACGKSFVSSFLSKAGYKVIDTDRISHNITADGANVNSELAKAFPEAVRNGVLNRKELANIVFNNPKRREILNSILHPIIYEITKNEINNSDGIIFVDVPLMFEAHFDELCDRIICVYTDFNTQINRLISRDSISYKEALNKINSQMSLKEKMEKSDYLLKSEEDFNDTINNITTILENIKEAYYVKTSRNI